MRKGGEDHLGYSHRVRCAKGTELFIDLLGETGAGSKDSFGHRDNISLVRLYPKYASDLYKNIGKKQKPLTVGCFVGVIALALLTLEWIDQGLASFQSSNPSLIQQCQIFKGNNSECKRADFVIVADTDRQKVIL